MTDSFLSENRDKMRENSSPHPEKTEKVDQQALREISQDVGGSVENAEIMGTGEVSETNREDKKQYTGGSTGGALQGSAAISLKQITPPSVEVMREQVQVEIKKQIHILEQEANRIARQRGAFSPFTFAGVVSKIRELNEMLNQLAYVTYETLKSWWMKYVKDVTI